MRDRSARRTASKKATFVRGVLWAVDEFLGALATVKRVHERHETCEDREEGLSVALGRVAT